VYRAWPQTFKAMAGEKLAGHQSTQLGARLAPLRSRPGSDIGAGRSPPGWSLPVLYSAFMAVPRPREGHALLGVSSQRLALEVSASRAFLREEPQAEQQLPPWAIYEWRQACQPPKRASTSTFISGFLRSLLSWGWR
jgi:hypothetical protein